MLSDVVFGLWNTIFAHFGYLPLGSILPNESPMMGLISWKNSHLSFLFCVLSLIINWLCCSLVCFFLHGWSKRVWNGKKLIRLLVFCKACSLIISDLSQKNSFGLWRLGPDSHALKTLGAESFFSWRQEFIFYAPRDFTLGAYISLILVWAFSAFREIRFFFSEKCLYLPFSYEKRASIYLIIYRRFLNGSKE